MMLPISDPEAKLSALNADDHPSSSVPLYVRDILARRVYLLLALQWALTTSACVVASKGWVHVPPEIGLAAPLVTLPLVCAVPCVGPRFPWNLLLLLAITVCTSASLAHLAERLGDPHAVLTAVAGTTVTFAGLTAVGWHRDLTAWGEWLLAALIALLFFPPIVWATGVAWPHAVYAWLGVVLFVGYVLYDTSMLARVHGPDDAVEVCLHLYLDVVNLFASLLSILSGDGCD